MCVFAVIHFDKEVNILDNWINQSWFLRFNLKWHDKTVPQLQPDEFYDCMLELRMQMKKDNIPDFIQGVN